MAWLVSRLVLAVVFFLCVLPMSLVLRALRRDPLQRRFRADERSFWVRSRAPEGAARRAKRMY